MIRNMKKLIYYLAWIFSCTALAVLIIAAIAAVAGSEIAHVKWYTLWWADINLILFSILLVLLYSQVKEKPKEEK